MQKLASVFICALLLVGGALGDMYLQNPRGSNDRLNENGDRQNANRLFDSQNNARGGYCWGPPMSFVTGSILPIEWTAQHGCGGEHVTCNEVIQYMCTDTATIDPNSVLRDGTTTTTIPNDGNANNKEANGQFTYGMQENQAYYNECRARERNKGLFIADQTLSNEGRATQTRQNNNGQRSGFECPEERDYYPYWHPSPWKDIAVLVQNLDQCAYYQAESQNVKEKSYCSITVDPNGNTRAPNNERACVTAGGNWTAKAAFGIPPPACQLAEFSRDNHLGNTLGGKTANFSWVLPSAAVEPCILTSTCACAIRIRYNITTNESTAEPNAILDSRNNSAASPITEDPTVLVEGARFTLAIDTAQTGRTFQDRSHMFKITPRPKGVSADTKIYNLNVRGKRGNIVQTFPATEYDYTPNDLKVEEGDIVHFQWTGCDTNPAGNQGEGRQQTDRSNIVQIKNLDSNIPLAAVKGANESIYHMFDSPALRKRMANIDQDLSTCVITNNDQDENNCAKLNAAKTPYFDGGLVRMNKTGTFYYTSTRNNNFSNRTQKGTLTVGEKKKIAEKASYGIAVVVGIAVVAGAFGGLVFYGKKNPHSTVGRMVDRLPSIPIERFMPSRTAAPANSARREPLLSSP
jgi:hypothetical protein